MFHPFSRLPPELRQQIWNDSLPEEVGQAFYHYKAEDCWRLRPLMFWYDDFHSVLLEHQELLDPAYFEISLLFVNRESRIIARKWLDKQGIETYLLQDGWSIAFPSPFDTYCDGLYNIYSGMDGPLDAIFAQHNLARPDIEAFLSQNKIFYSTRNHSPDENRP